MNYPLASTTWDNKELNAIKEVVDSGQFTMGKNVKIFEKEFASFFGNKYAVMVNSGSSANLLATAALFFTQNNALKRGDEVIVPAVSWSTSYFPLQQYGLKCKFVDIDAKTLNYNLESLQEAITDKTRVILVVNLLGNPNDFSTIEKIIDNRNIIIIEDNCESMGAEFKGKMAGTFGLVGTFSTFFSHHISTMEGGVVITDSEEIYHILLSLRSHGWTRHLPEKNLVTGIKSDNPFEESFKFVLPGYNLRPGELNGAIGIQQLKKLPELLKVRRKNAEIFVKSFKNHPYIQIQEETGKSSWFGFSLIVKPDSPFSREELLNLLTENNIETRPVVSGNFLKNPVLKYFDYTVYGKIVNAEIVEDNGLFVGNHHYDLSKEIDYLYKIIAKLY
ncbi:MAG: pyridoxamine 5-phosphate oxidase [Bacteroidetes bacterium GWF2_38_335]|nr:MAG: pyridoxamine 5-phosphate oxidase [Bacteroidetes bacterium GWF2_38_335]OFY76942.1 MAG: pyridoxamine 5-phosphate oxidase [Bacteroidetes bacterium RIFOXYA12_FULL_38_20]HBS86794.1 pyridoxamine 5-phosphate oxidase [Bacteroidales bacterium]